MTGKSVTMRAEAKTAGAVIPSPALSAFRRRESDLTSFEYDAPNEHGRTVSRVYPLPRVDHYTRLIPEAECEDIIAELEAALTPARSDQARVLAQTVVGRYPARDMNNPEVFAREMARAFGGAPADLGQQAADELRAAKFLPNPGDVLEVLRPLVNARTRALRQVRLHLAEHQRRRAEAAAPKLETYRDLTPTERAAFDAEINRLKHGGQPRSLAEVLGRTPGGSTGPSRTLKP